MRGREKGLPSCLSFRVYSSAGNTSSDAELSDDATNSTPRDFYSLKVPLSQVVFVEDEHGLQKCWKTIGKVSIPTYTSILLPRVYTLATTVILEYSYNTRMKFQCLE